MAFTDPPPDEPKRCGHLAIQTTIVDTCMDCGQVVCAHEALTGLPIYVKEPCVQHRP
jgi:hypothetical protein